MKVVSGILSAVLVASLATGCDKLSSTSTPATTTTDTDQAKKVEELVNARLEAEKGRVAIEENTRLKTENEALKAKVEELEKEIAANAARTSAKVAQAAKPATKNPTATTPQSERAKQLQALKEQLQGGSRK